MPQENNTIPNIKQLPGAKPRVGEVTSLIDSFNKTSLDLENPTPLGGPNRTNSTNIDSGVYTNINYDTGASINTVTLHQWAPNRTYLDSLKGADLNSLKIPSTSTERERETRIPNK